MEQGAGESQHLHRLTTPALSECVRRLPQLGSIPLEHRVWALVCVGRFSRSFLHTMAAAWWEQGNAVFEEISLPSTCLAAPNCTLAQFATNRSARAAKVKFRPAQNCTAFLRARELNTNELWHPVKQRTCYARWLSRHDGVTTPLQSQAQPFWAPRRRAP